MTEAKHLFGQMLQLSTSVGVTDGDPVGSGDGLSDGTALGGDVAIDGLAVGVSVVGPTVTVRVGAAVTDHSPQRALLFGCTLSGAVLYSEQLYAPVRFGTTALQATHCSAALHLRWHQVKPSVCNEPML